MRLAFMTLLFNLILSMITLPSFAVEMGITTGGQTGTYIKIGEDIKQIAKPSGIKLNVLPSKGSIENILRVRKQRGVQVGIVQSDVLEYVKSISSDRKLKKIAEKIRLVYPLYNEEVHILSSFDIDSIEGLAGKKVAVGSKKSGTYLTAKTIFYHLNLDVQEVYSSGTEALTKLRNNEIDAMIYVAGAPATLFSENTKEDDKFHLIPINDKALNGIYTEVVIPPNTYPWQDEEITTVAVKATLVSFDYKGTHCQNVGKLSTIIKRNKRWLNANGHPKWKQVNLDEQLPKWKQYECVSSTTKRDRYPDIPIEVVR